MIFGANKTGTVFMEATSNTRENHSYSYLTDQINGKGKNDPPQDMRISIHVGPKKSSAVAAPFSVNPDVGFSSLGNAGNGKSW